MRSPKFTFIPENQMNPSEPLAYKVSISGKGMLYFSKDVLETYELANKLVRLYADVEKKVIGWRVITEEGSLEALKDLRRLTVNPSGSCQLSIQALIKTLSPMMVLPRKGIDVKKYSAAHLEEDIYYIELN